MNRALALAVLAAPLAPARAGDVTQSLANGLEVRAFSPWPAHVQSGWAPIFVELRNPTERALEATVTAQRREWIYEWTGVARATLGAGQSQALELLAPMSADYSTDARIDVRSGRERAWLTGVLGMSGLTHGVRALVLFTERRFEPGELERWNAALGAAPSSEELRAQPMFTASVGAAGAPVDADIAPVRAEHAPAHAAAYSSLDLVVLDASAPWPSGARFGALVSWMRTGGDVLVIGPDAERVARASSELAAWIEPRFELPGAARAGRGYRAGLGRLWIASEELELEGAQAAWVSAAVLDTRSRAVLRSSDARASAVSARLALQSVPRRVFAILLLAFALLIGPLNFIAIARRKRPALLLVTIPAISLSVSAVLLAYGIFHQGLDVKTASCSTSVLDERTHVASTIEKRELFAGLAPAAGLRLQAGTSLQQLGDSALRSGVMDGQIALRSEHSSGWLLSGDFLPTRRKVTQLLTVDRAERARLDVRFENGSAQVVNNLGARVEQLLVRDESGRAFALEGRLEAGAGATLAPLDEESARVLERTLASGVAPATPERGAPVELVPASGYAARLTHNPLRDDCGVPSNELVGRHMVLGVLPHRAQERR